MIQLQSLLRTTESGIKWKSVVFTPRTAAAPILAIGQGKGKRGKLPQNKIGRESPKSGRLAMALKASLVLKLHLPLILKKLPASTTMTWGIRREASPCTYKI